MAKLATRNTAVAVKPLKITPESAKYCGSEPIWTGVELTEATRMSQLLFAINWYNYNFDAKDAKQCILEYLKTAKRADEYKGFKKVKEGAVPNAIGWLLRMTAVGWVMSAEEHTRVDTVITQAINSSAGNAEVVEETAEEKAATAASKKTTIQDRMREKAAEAGGEIEHLLDLYAAEGAPAKHAHKPLDVLKLANILPQHTSSEVAHWEYRRDEFKSAHLGTDEDTAEGYSHYTKTQLRNLIKFCELVIADLHSYVSMKKANRAPIQRKVKTPVQLVQKFKYMPECTEFKIKSISPTQLVGAKEVYAYDTKKRKLMYFVADEYAGTLTVKNSSIDGFDAVKSTQKTIRKPAEQLKEFMAVSKPNARKLFEKTKSVEVKVSGRFNEHVVLLKAW